MLVMSSKQSTNSSSPSFRRIRCRTPWNTAARAQRTTNPVLTCHFSHVQRDCRHSPTATSCFFFASQRNGLAHNRRSRNSTAKYVQRSANFSLRTAGGARNLKKDSTSTLALSLTDILFFLDLKDLSNFFWSGLRRVPVPCSWKRLTLPRRTGAFDGKCFFVTSLVLKKNHSIFQADISKLLRILICYQTDES